MTYAFNPGDKVEIAFNRITDEEKARLEDSPRSKVTQPNEKTECDTGVVKQVRINPEGPIYLVCVDDPNSAKGHLREIPEDKLTAI